MHILREAAWSEVVAQFANNGGEPQAIANAHGWASRFNVPRERYPYLAVTLELWESYEIRFHMAEMSKIEPRLSVDIVDGINNAQLPPRIANLPATLIRYGRCHGIIDGKHRMHQWAKTPGNYAVLVVQSLFLC